MSTRIAYTTVPASALRRVRWEMKLAQLRRTLSTYMHHAYSWPKRLFAALRGALGNFPSIPGKILVTVASLVALAVLGSAPGARLLGLGNREALARDLPAPSQGEATLPSPHSSASPPVTEGAPKQETAPETPVHHGRATAEDPVYVNEADATELRRLPGIGAKRADAILALRARKQRFTRIEELLAVKGIGAKTLVKLRPLIRLARPQVPTPSAAQPAKEQGGANAKS